MAKIALVLAFAMLLAPPSRGEDWEKLADAEAAESRPAKAADYLSRALALRPGDSALLKKHAELASWAGDSAAAERSYRALLRVDPYDDDSRYQLANVISWQGRTAEAIGVVEEHVVRRPEDAKAFLFLGQLRRWNGDEAGSAEALERYKALAGADQAYMAAKVQRLSGAGDDLAAANLAAAALKRFPDDCDLYTSKAEAESSLRRWGDMSGSLVHVSTACPDQASVGALSRRLNAPLRSDVRGDASYARDSTGVDIGAYSFEGRYRLDPGTYLSAGVESGWLRAVPGSGLETARGDARVDLRGGWLGAERLVGDGLWLNARVGHRAASEGDGGLLAKAGAEYRPIDGLWLRNDFGSDLYAVSPRAVSDGVRMTEDTMHAAWRFSPRGTLYVDAGYASVSDGNFLWTGTVTPRWTVLGGGTFNLDAGVSAKVSSFNDPANGSARGYYAPNRYRQFQANVLSSWVLGPEDSIYASVNMGAVRDENQPRYGFSYDYSFEGVFGLYRDWLINPRVDFLVDLGISGGAGANYHRQQYALNLMRRF